MLLILQESNNSYMTFHKYNFAITIYLTITPQVREIESSPYDYFNYKRHPAKVPIYKF